MLATNKVAPEKGARLVIQVSSHLASERRNTLCCVNRELARARTCNQGCLSLRLFKQSIAVGSQHKNRPPDTGQPPPLAGSGLPSIGDQIQVRGVSPLPGCIQLDVLRRPFSLTVQPLLPVELPKAVCSPQKMKWLLRRCWSRIQVLRTWRSERRSTSCCVNNELARARTCN
jgi:hypothetical protein